MEFALLGSVEARVGGRPVGLGHRRQQCVLAALLVDANRLVTVGRLIDRVWAENPPQRARDTLYGYLSRLRRALAVSDSARILRRPGGYTLAVPAPAVDVHRFRELAAQARDAGQDDRAARLFGQALDLWRGEAFAGLDTPWISGVREALARERSAAQAGYDEARLRLGQHAEVLAGLTDRARAHPLDEGVTGRLMLALYRCGRPAEALDHYRRTRLRLVEELGCEPGPALQQLHRRMLAADPELLTTHPEPTAASRPRAPRRQAPASPATSATAERPPRTEVTSATPEAAEATEATEALETPGTPTTPAPPETGAADLAGRPQENRIVGRVAELAALDRALASARADASAVVEIVGEPGIGKTRLAGELGERARRQGFVVLTGRAVEFTRTPYGVFADALDDRLVTPNTDWVRAAQLPTDVLALLGEVFPALAWLHPDGTEPMVAGRCGLQPAMRALLEALGSDAGSGLMLALDDLHWADEDSLELIGHLIRHAPRGRFLLVLGYRPRPHPRRLAAALSVAEAQGRLTRIEPGPLSPAEVADMCRELCGEGVPRRRIRELHEAGHGNPFYLQALTRWGTPRRVLRPVPRPVAGPVPRPVPGPVLRPASAPAGELLCGEDLPQFLRAALQEELDGLPVLTQTCARAGAVLGDSFDADLASVVAGADEAAALAAFDELTERDLLRRGGLLGRFAFRHPLVRTAVYHSAGSGWRIEAHRRAANALALRDAPPAARAPHIRQSARPGDALAVEALVAAADQMTALAPVTAAEWLGAAIALSDPRQERPQPELLLKQATALITAGRLHEGQDILRTAAHALPAGDLRLRARIAVTRADVEYQLGHYRRATALLLRELKDGADGLSPAETADLRLGVASVALRRGDADSAAEWSEEALRTLLEPGGDGPRRESLRAARARSLLALAHATAGDAAQAELHLERAVQTLDDTDDRVLAPHVDVLALAGWTELTRGNLDTALRHLDRGLRLARLTGRTAVAADLFAASAHVLTLLGRLDEAEAHAEDAAEAAVLIGNDEPRSLAASACSAVALWRGDVTRALAACEEAMSRDSLAPGPPRAAIGGMLGPCLLESGDPAGCVRAVLTAGGGTELLRFGSLTRPRWFRVLTRAELARGDVAAAGRWAGDAAAALTPDSPVGQRGFALLARAEVGLSREEAEAAEQADEAALAFRTARMPLYEATASLTAGSVLAARGRHAEAVTRFVRARDLSVSCGAPALRDRAEEHLRRSADARRRD
ncbi:BTAD domain-containing putative transcriptional regulator [Streptomyces roseifaciens]|uniref:BTAD domain-containing putative transcriptional regulator n=1 Tax=Streptomyces roseifaciens TaxID=1488406 RepID=UPI000717E4C3|nr:BTAD domain-containing putative transcriptional regulator [Streptomyces roseifaciens]